MSWDDDVRDADWRAYALRNGMPVTDAGEAVETRSSAADRHHWRTVRLRGPAETTAAAGTTAATEAPAEGEGMAIQAELDSRSLGPVSPLHDQLNFNGRVDIGRGCNVRS
jgi:hypothetical protein